MDKFSVKDHLLYRNGNQVEYEPSPNHGGKIQPTLIVIHYTGDNGRGGLEWLCSSESGVSAHLWIGKDGEVIQLVPFNVRAFHAGVSSWDDSPGNSVNPFSIGIENQGIGDDWPEEQVETICGVVVALYKAYQITDTVGHEDVAPGRKVDPGPNFPWDKVEKALKEV